jgi:hypothetical protein
MSHSKFVPSTGALIGVSLGIGVLAAVLVGSGALGSGIADQRELVRILRAVLFGTATTLFGVVFLKVWAYYRDPTTGLGKWLGTALAGAAGCLLAAWVLTVQLR